jgi:hypothetical protein
MWALALYWVLNNEPKFYRETWPSFKDCKESALRHAKEYKLQGGKDIEWVCTSRYAEAMDD